MKNKLAAFALTLFLSVLALSSCDDPSMSSGKYNKVHIFDGGATQGVCVDIKSYDLSSYTGADVITTEGKSIHLSEGTYLLVQDYCYICKK